MEELCVALVQKHAHGHVEQNLEDCQKIALQAKKGGAHLVLFPRLWLNGGGGPLAWEGFSSSAAQQALCATAGQLQIAIVVAGAFTQKGELLDKTLLIDEQGRIALEYDSVHPLDAPAFGHGERFGVARVHGFDIGLMSDHDADFPESARMLRLLGAQVVLVDSNRQIRPFYLQQLAVRACENQVGIAMANAPGEEKGRSCAFTPWEMQSAEEAKHVLALAGQEEEGLYYCTFLQKQIMQVRQSAGLWPQRVPAAYQPLFCSGKQ